MPIPWPFNGKLRCSGAKRSPSQKGDNEFRRVFEFLDTNNDGNISAEELTAYFASVGEVVAIEDLKVMIREFGGNLGFEEFMRVMELRDCGGENILRQAFEVFEVEKGCGLITAEGLRKVLRRLGSVRTKRECAAMINAFDLDGNGALDFDEFCNMMKGPNPTCVY